MFESNTRIVARYIRAAEVAKPVAIITAPLREKETGFQAEQCDNVI